ncbi:heme oxygenase [Oceanobacillus bengalensis]|uniref:Heme oxygenase n=1 Tax=Oceanobacillus bengalensis TaxID=1435466 RepID=A0A494YR43_9BACI|nr:heme oxygenase [Oceanobacillus bengalensis]RKQ11507.1 heme oxygenase [Oceanobacillus bengalensis]
MIVVTNKIKMKKGFAEKMAPRFTKPGPLQEMKGFKKVEVTITQNLVDYDEMNVNMYWESHEDFQAWKDSDLFKEAHKDSKSKSEEEKSNSPILGSEIIMAEVASVLESTS